MKKKVYLKRVPDPALTVGCAGCYFNQGNKCVIFKQTGHDLEKWFCVRPNRIFIQVAPPRGEE